MSPVTTSLVAVLVKSALMLSLCLKSFPPPTTRSFPLRASQPSQTTISPLTPVVRQKFSSRGSAHMTKKSSLPLTPEPFLKIPFWQEKSLPLRVQNLRNPLPPVTTLSPTKQDAMTLLLLTTAVAMHLFCSQL